MSIKQCVSVYQYYIVLILPQIEIIYGHMFLEQDRNLIKRPT